MTRVQRTLADLQGQESWGPLSGGEGVGHVRDLCCSYKKKLEIRHSSIENQTSGERESTTYNL